MKLAFTPMRTDEDKRFVLASWLDASRSSYSSGLVPMSSWYPTMWPVYEAITARPDMRTIIAHEHGDPTGYIGFIVADPTEQRVPGKSAGHYSYWPALVVFVYVKAPYRRDGYDKHGRRVGDGIGRQLFAAAGVDPSKPFLYASDTPWSKRLGGKAPLAKYNPLMVRYPKEPKAA